jgi:ASCH domain.
MKVLSVRQPWAWALIFGGKDIENRYWTTKYRGPIAIHASKGLTRKEFEIAKEYMLEIIPRVPNMDELDRGAIIGIVDLVDITQNTDSPWFEGPDIFGKENFGWVVTNPRPVVPKFYTGGLGLRDLKYVELTERS